MRYLFICMIWIMMGCSSQRLLPKDIHHLDMASIDALNNVYTLYSDNTIIKRSVSGDTLAIYNNARWGDISTIDVTNPQKIMAYARRQGNILIFDNDLSLLKEITMSDGLQSEVSLVATARDNNLWMWNDLNKQIIKVNQNLEPVTVGMAMYDYNYSIDQPSSLLEINNKLYLRDGQQVYVFDNYASFLYKVDIEAWSTIQIKDDDIMYFDENMILHRITPPLMTELQYDTYQKYKNDSILDANIYGQYLLLKTDEDYQLIDLSSE